MVATTGYDADAVRGSGDGTTDDPLLVLLAFVLLTIRVLVLLVLLVTPVQRAFAVDALTIARDRIPVVVVAAAVQRGRQRGVGEGSAVVALAHAKNAARDELAHRSRLHRSFARETQRIDGGSTSPNSASWEVGGGAWRRRSPPVLRAERSTSTRLAIAPCSKGVSGSTSRSRQTRRPREMVSCTPPSVATPCWPWVLAQVRLR